MLSSNHNPASCNPPSLIRLYKTPNPRAPILKSPTVLTSRKLTATNLTLTPPTATRGRLQTRRRLLRGGQEGSPPPRRRPAVGRARTTGRHRSCSSGSGPRSCSIVFQLAPDQTPYRDSYFLQKLLYLKGDDGFEMNPVLVSLWFIMGLWPLVYSMLLIPTGRSEMWEWPEEEFNLQTDPGDDISQYLWDGANQNEGSLLPTLDEHTPIKDCAGFGYQGPEPGDNVDKELEEFRDSSLLKRRRVLEFTSDTNENDIVYEQSNSIFIKYKAREGSSTGDEFSEDLQLDSRWNLGFPDGRSASGFEGIQQSSPGWLARINESQMHYNPDETNYRVPSDDQGNISESYNVSSEMETDMVQKSIPPARPKIYRGKKSLINIPRKLTTSVVYPFALIKPCGAEGDVTLKDINQRIHGPTSSRSKHMKDDDPSLAYPTSAITGKPVVVKTKIRTEGKGSITIMRTKG